MNSVKIPLLAKDIRRPEQGVFRKAQAMDFIADYWFVWLILGPGCTIALALLIISHSSHFTKDQELSRGKDMMKIVMFIVLGIGVVIADPLLLISIAVNLIRFAKG